MKKIKLLVDESGHYIGDVIEYKLFNELTEDEVKATTSNPNLFEEDDVFIKCLDTENQYEHMYMHSREFEFVKED